MLVVLLCIFLSVLFGCVHPLAIHWIWPRVGSIAGGTTIDVHGTGFATDQYTAQNIIFLGDFPCIVQGYTVSPTLLKCVTLPHPGAYEGFTSQRYQLRIISKGLQYQSSSSAARFQFHWSYTPQVKNIIPSSGPIESLIEVGGYRFSYDIANRYTRILLGNQICDFWNENTNSVYGGRWYYGLYYIKCLVKELTPGAWNVSAILTGASGMTWNHSQAMKFGHDGKLSMFELYPDVHSVQPEYGGINGGTLLTITGTGFGVAKADLKLEVDVDGVPCEIIKHSRNEILCWTNPPRYSDDSNELSVENGHRYYGSRGVSVHKYNVLNSYKVNDLYNLPTFPDSPDEVALFPSFSPESAYGYSNYGARYMAFFNPAQSGRHTFFIKADDSAVLYLQKGRNITDLSEIARVHSHSSWSSSTTDYSSARSEAIDLTAGEKYLLVGDMAEYHGGDFLRVGVLMHDTKFYFNETQQSIRERQIIEFTSHGYYDIQNVFVQIDLALVNDSNPPLFELVWGSRSKNITLNELLNNDGIIAEATYTLLKGICQFQPSFGVYYYNDNAYDFEENLAALDCVKDASYCGLQSAYVTSEAIIIDPNKNAGFFSENYPFLCMAYKIPADLQVDVILHIDGFGWRSVSLTPGATGHKMKFLNDWSNSEFSNDIIADDQWRFGCTNTDSLLFYLNSDSVKLKITGLGFQVLGNENSGGFHVDVLSFTSEPLSIESHQAPSKPGGISVDQLFNTSHRELTDNDTLLSVNVSFEVVPTTCDHEIPLISFVSHNQNDDSILEYGSIKLQNASETIKGTYRLGLNGNWTEPIQYFADRSQIIEALNALPDITGINAWYRSEILPQDKLGMYCPGRKLVIRFDRNPGDMPLLEMNASNLTGHGLQVNVKEIETGGLFLYPIPGHMLQTVEETPQIHVKINNQMAACGGGLEPYEFTNSYNNPCGFTFNESSTPIVNSIFPIKASNGDIITITGEGFGSDVTDNFVLFGDIECNVTQVTDTSLTCVIRRGQAGMKKLWLHVLSGSVAKTDGISLEYKVSLLSVDPTSSGTKGGIEVTLMGDGFVGTDTEETTLTDGSLGYSYSGYRSARNNCNSWKNMVLIDEDECVINSASKTEIKCIVPAGTAGTVDVSVSVLCDDVNSTEEYTVSAISPFTYDTGLDPTIASVSPSSGSGRGGETVSIIGTNFPSSIDEVTVMIGGSPCVVSSVVGGSNIECVTSPHNHGTVEVVVTVVGKGIAVGYVEYGYQLEVTGISKCAGSLFGGQLVIISGSGFGIDSDGVEIVINSVYCSVENVTDKEIKCLTGATKTTHLITNNAQNPNYGLGYAWDNPELNITIGDRVEWKWTGSAFTPLKRIVQVDSPSANDYNGYGFASDKALTGSFAKSFSVPGNYYYIMEGYGKIGFRGSISVQPLSDLDSPISITLNSVSVTYTASDVCGQAVHDDTPPSYSYLVSETPIIKMISPSTTRQGLNIEVTVEGIMNLTEYNILTIGGKPCTSSDHTSTNETEPALELPIAPFDYINTVINCTVPDVYPGDYRVILHVSGRGWAYGELNNTIVKVEAAIPYGLSKVNGSLGGGTLLSIPVQGLDSYMIGHTNVHIGNTPCPIQTIIDVSDNPQLSEIVCRTEVPRDDGYSSLVSGTALCYWSLQYDLYDSSNKKYGTESFQSFSSKGKISFDVPAAIVGVVLQRKSGISGNIHTDQSAHFSLSYLSVKSFEQYHNLQSFSFELWFKSMSPSGKYVILAASYQNEGGAARGFIIALNPCNKIEFWMGTSGHPPEESGSGDNDTDCETADSMDCNSECKSGHIVQFEEDKYHYQLPVGVWNILRSSSTISTDESKWNHLVFGFDVLDNTSSDEKLLEGVQKMYINGEASEANVTYHHTNSSGITFGGSGILHTNNVAVLSTVSQLYPFFGYLDEISLFDFMLTEEEVKTHYHYGTSDDQPIWINTEFVDGVGKGTVPKAEIMLLETAYDEVAFNISLNDLDDQSFSLPKQKGIHVYWNGLHGLLQVSPDSYESCLQVDIEKEWSPSQLNGSLNLWLESGYTYFFIDPVGDNCADGVKFKVNVGDVVVIDWKVGEHNDINITEGGGVVFKWNDVLPHNVIEMTSKESVSEACAYVGEKGSALGKVAKEWFPNPSLSGEVFINGLSIGQHHFVCSVGSHCELGMRLTITVTPLSTSRKETLITKDSDGYTVPWYIPSKPYQPLTILEGEEVLFAWNAFHSLHQVTKEVFDSCDTSVDPLYEWGRPSVDNSVRISDLHPGTYYFICSVSGHCDAGMKLQLNVVERSTATPIDEPLAARCITNSGFCSFSYSEDTTPRLSSVEPEAFKSGDTVTLRLTNHNYGPSVKAGDTLSTTTVLIGSYPCQNVILKEANPLYNELVCTAPNQEAGSHRVKLHIENIGYARPNGSVALSDDSSNEFVVSVSASVSSVTPTKGSVKGGTMLTLTGTGFSHLANRMTVDIGGHSCSIVELEKTSLKCITAPLPLVAPGSNIPISLTISGNPTTTTLNYVYDSDSTPTVSSLSKKDEVVGGDTLIIGGTKYLSSLVSTKVQILSSSESFYHSNGPEKVVCTVTSASETSITCTAPYRGAGIYKVVVHVTGKGYSEEESIGSSIIVYKLDVDAVSPMECGHGGGVVLNITGSGFPTDSKDDVEIKVCDSLCRVMDVFSEDKLSCMLDPSDTEDESNDLICDIVVTYNNLQASASNFTFNASLTPKVTHISPNSGGTAGGTFVTIKGEGLLPLDSSPITEEDLVVSIDTAVCQWNNQDSLPAPNSTVIVCRTSDHLTTVLAKVKVFVGGKGNALTADGVGYHYVDRWSSRFTWGGLEPPVEGESVYIKEGQTVFLDTNTPVLNLILIEGALVFEDEQDVHLQAKYIFINNGRLQIGTEDEPFIHKATITLHGNVRDPEIPIYGAKVIGIRQGELDIHGRKRNITWTRLGSTALKNTSQLVLQEPVDWSAGESIVIAPTGKEGNETETHVIDSVSEDGITVTLRDPLSYTHYGITETFEDGQFIDIRAEVGLLSHNVVIQGALADNEEFDGKGADQYGAQIMIHRTGPHPTPIRIEHAEIRYMGQAFRLGRYAIHFHLSGNMNGSYIKNCAIHHSNNRALTAHGVHNLLIKGNVAYDIKGHAFFVEDGIETNNRYIHNLGIYTRSSSSLLNTDQLPAVFWITNPNNVFIDNAAVASRAYGFWYDLDGSPSGPSYTPSVCPNKEVFGQFSDNMAHSCNEFGLRIWESYTPFADGCSAKEPSIASLYNLTTYANDIHGVEFSVVSNVRIIGFKVADNRDNGIEIQETIGDQWGGATIEDTLVVSYTSVNSDDPGTGGIKTPNTPGLTVSNVTFANFDFPGTACLKACSHCKKLQGGFQVWFEKIKFIGNSSFHKASFQWEHEVLFRDLDGSLSGVVGGWVTPNSGLHPSHSCTKSVPEFSVNINFPGTVCESDVYLLRLSWNRVEPFVTFLDKGVNVSNEFGFSIVPWRHYRLTHMDGYMLTLPSTYTHNMQWLLPDQHRVDVSSYSAGVYSIRPQDYVILRHEFVQSPDHVNIGGNRAPEDSEVDSLDASLSWYIDNITDSVSYIVSGINVTESIFDRKWSYRYEPCPIDGCPQPPDPNNQPQETNQRRWSDPMSWPSGKLPSKGEAVTISSTWRMLLDLSPPPLGLVVIAGELQFEDVRDYNFTANTILIQGLNAHLIIGEAESPFSHSATITLTGKRDDHPLFLSSSMRLGSKAIGVFGNVTMFGQPKSHTWTRLKQSCTTGDTTIYLRDQPNWSVGDSIVIASSSYEPTEAEIRRISNYDSATGTITIDEPLKYSHIVHQFVSDSELEVWKDSNLDNNPWWGGEKEDVTLSPEVGLLSHNIVIQGGEDDEEPLEQHHYGCRILIGEYTTFLMYTYTGSVSIDSVEVRFCGQGGYFSPRDPRYSIAFKDIGNANSFITRSSVHHGYNTAIGVHSSSGVEITDTVVYRTTGSSIICGGSGNTVSGNLAMVTSTVQPNRPLDSHAVDLPATFDIDRGNIIRDNAAAGSNRISFRFTGESCSANRQAVTGNSAMFWNNTAHSGLIALVILGLPTDCASVAGLTASHHWDYSIFSSSASSLSVSHMKLAIGKVGVNLNIFGPDPVAHYLGRKSVQLSNSLIVGYLPEENCATSIPSSWIPSVSFTKKDIATGIMMSSFNKRRSKMDGTGKWHLMKGYPTVDGEAVAVNITFAHFTPPNNCLYSASLISNNPLSPDAVHPLELRGVVKLDVPLQSLVHFYDPDPDWIVQEDCVDMDCDGPKHALIRDSDGLFGGTAPFAGSVVPFAELRFDNYSSRIPITWLDFEGAVSVPEGVVDFRGVYRGNPLFFTPDGSCKWMEEWNAYKCQGLDHLMLVIESMDGDSETRRVSPLALVGEGAWHYTDLLNGPMDHGWCTYYTCLKRLSTFFTVVSTGIDYYIWMTGSLPGSLRLHLLNSNDSQVIRVNIWYKDPKRKDVYKNGIFIEPANTNFLENGAVTQLDGDHTPLLTSFSGANYFERTSQLLTLILKGPDPVEIRTPPVIQISLDVAVSIDDFFITNLINNLAFVLKIDVSRIRVVNIIAEDSVVKRRRSLLQAMSNSTVTLEFGDPPDMEVDPPATISSKDDWMASDGESDSVDIQDDSVSSVNNTNPYNEDPPVSDEDFITDYNSQADAFNENLKQFETAIAKVTEVNELGSSVVELIQTGVLNNFSITAVNVIPAVTPSLPTAPVIPPEYFNISYNSNLTLAIINETSQSPPEGDISSIKFLIPSTLVVSREPATNTGHLVYVAVSMLDANGNVAEALGFLKPWTCTAMLITEDSESPPKLEGEVQVQFKEGFAVFTRLRVNKPSSNLRLSFTTSPGSFYVETSVTFSVHDPPEDTIKKRVVFILVGNTSLLLSLDYDVVVNDIINSLSVILDVDVSRFQNVDFIIQDMNYLQLSFDLLENATTDPPDVPSLNDTVERLQNYMENMNLTLTINGTLFRALNGTIDSIPTQDPISNPIVVIVSVGVVCLSILFLMVAVAFVAHCLDERKKKRKIKNQDIPIRFNYESESDDGSFVLRMRQIPRARVGGPPNIIGHLPHSPEPLPGSTESTDEDELWSSMLNESNPTSWNFPTPKEMPRIPRPFSQLPLPAQRRQSTTLASLSRVN